MWPGIPQIVAELSQGVLYRRLTPLEMMKEEGKDGRQKRSDSRRGEKGGGHHMLLMSVDAVSRGFTSRQFQLVL